MFKKILILIITALFIFSCDIKPEEEESKEPYVGSWKVVSESNNTTETSQIIEITNDSYKVSTQIKDLEDNVVLQNKVKHWGTLTEATDTTFNLTMTHKVEGGTEYPIAPSDQVARSVTWRVADKQLTLVDSTTDELFDVSGEYIKE